jgi:hypothetical protein
VLDVDNKEETETRHALALWLKSRHGRYKWLTSELLTRLIPVSFEIDEFYASHHR